MRQLQSEPIELSLEGTWEFGQPTLLDLVAAVSDELPSQDDRVVADIVCHMLVSGRARLLFQDQEIAA